MKVFCKNCGGEYDDTPYRVNNGKSKYCSRKCYNTDKRNKKYEERTCKICDNSFEVRKKDKKQMCSDSCRNVYSSSKERNEKMMETSKKTCLEKYGTETYFNSDEFKEKKNKTNIVRYGHIHPMKNKTISENLSKTLKSKTITEWEEIDNKRKKTKKEKYDDGNYNNREKFTNTLQEKYGGHHLRLPEYIQKQKNTFLDRYGVDSVFKFDGMVEKSKSAIKEKYGTKFYSQSDDYKEKQLIKKINNLKERADKQNLTFISYEKGTKGNCLLLCNECNHQFTHSQTYREYPIICRKCNPIQNNNVLSTIIEDFLDSLNVKYQKNNRQLIKPYEIDFLIEDHKIAIEINGNYWHSEIGGDKQKKYHINKTNLCQKENIKLIHIFEDEILYKKDVVFSRLEQILNKTNNVVYGRKCIIKEVSNEVKKSFLDDNHIQGNTVDKYRMGLFKDDVLVSLMTFSLKRAIYGGVYEDGVYELVRFCNKKGTSVVGGFSKLLKYFENSYNPKSIFSFADIRWSGVDDTKTVYSKNGFVFDGITQPNYWYVDRKKYLYRYNRFTFRKSVLILEGYDERMTEWGIMQSKNFDRIWDCGNMRFFKTF